MQAKYYTFGKWVE